MLPQSYTAERAQRTVDRTITTFFSLNPAVLIVCSSREMGSCVHSVTCRQLKCIILGAQGTGIYYVENILSAQPSIGALLQQRV